MCDIFVKNKLVYLYEITVLNKMQNLIKPLVFILFNTKVR